MDTTKSAILPLAAITLVGALGELILYVGPILLGAAVDAFGFSPGDAGYIVAAEFGLSAIAALYISARADLRRAKAIVLASTLLLIICDGASLLTSSPAIFIACRVTAAFGAGALFAIGNAAAARQENPQRVFSIMMFVAVMFATLIYALAPASIESLGPRGPFAALVVASLILLPFICFLPAGEAPAPASRTKAPPLSPVALTALLAIFTLYAAQGGLWAYVERIGQSLGLSIETISLVLTLNGFIALGAGLLAGVAGLRFGLFPPIAVAMTAQVAAAYALPINPQAAYYGASAIGFTFALIFVVPYFKAMLSTIDSTGRLAGVATAFITLGSAAGPALIGFALNQGADYREASLLTCAGLFAAWALAAVTLRDSKFRSLRAAKYN